MYRHHHPHLDLKRVRTIVEVARTGSITTAAQTLGLTQSAVSRSVAELETALGQRLFDRLPRGIQLTDAGHALLGRATRMLAEFDDMVSELASPAHQISGRLRVGMAPAGYWATATLIAFVREHPEVALETAHASEQNLCPRLLNGELDVVIGSSSYFKRWGGLDLSKLADLHFACVLRKNHPLAQVSAPAELDVLRYPLIQPESVEPVHSDLSTRYAHHGLPQMKPQYITNNPELIFQLIDATDAFFPIFHFSPEFNELDKRYLLLRDVVEMPAHDVSLARAAHRPRTRVVEVFERHLVGKLGMGSLLASGRTQG